MENELKPKQIETFAGDMAKVLDNPEEGMIKKLIEEQEAHDIDKKIYSPDSARNKFFIFGSFFLVAIGVIGLFFIYMTKNPSVLEIDPQLNPLIFLDHNSTVEVGKLSKEDIYAAVLSEVEKSEVKQNGVEGIYLFENNKVVGLRRLIALLKGNLSLNPDSFIEDNFLSGVVHNENKDFFILMKMRSHTDAFSDMRIWEDKMFLDLHGFFGFEVSPETSYLLTKDFEDGFMQNQNARILYDNEGNIVMSYVYADNNSILIINSEVATKEVIQRLASSKVKK